RVPESVPVDTAAALRTRLLVSVALAVPVVALAMVPALRFPGWHWVALALTAPVVCYGGWPFHAAAWTNLRHRAATMDTLISVGTLAAVGASIVGGRYLEVATVVTVFILAGRVFEAAAQRRGGAGR